MTFNDDIFLVTGSNGRIGTEVMRALRLRYDNVVGFDRYNADLRATISDVFRRRG